LAVQAELADQPLRFDVGLLRDLLALPLLPPLRLQVPGDVAPLGPGGVLPGLVLVSDLDGVIPVLLVRRLDLEDRARAELQDSDGGGLPLVVVHLRHSDLRTEETERHGKPQTGSGRALGARSQRKRKSISLGPGNGLSRGRPLVLSGPRTFRRPGRPET